MQRIGPDEYDEAVRLHPETCPLWTLGDRRTGRQLLADATADALRGLDYVVSHVDGRLALNELAAYVEAMFKL